MGSPTIAPLSQYSLKRLLVFLTLFSNDFSLVLVLEELEAAEAGGVDATSDGGVDAASTAAAAAAATTSGAAVATSN